MVRPSVVLGTLVATLLLTLSPAAAQNTGVEKKFEDFDKVVKGAKEYDGLFRLYQKDDHLFAEVRPEQLDKPYLCPIAIARGLGMGGYTLNFDEQWVLVFHRVGDRVQLIRRNVHFHAKAGSPVAHAVETTYADSVLLGLKIHSINPLRQSLLIDLNDIFMSDFAQLNLGGFDTSRSSWFKVKTFPRNIELEVTATFAGRHDDDSVIDSRGTTVVIHYGLTPLVEDGYQPRLADDRVGHFLSVVKDFSSDSKDSAFVRYVNRWRLERADTDPKNKEKLSAPKKKIVFWIEKSVPDEYRAFVREGILEWNKAFEKIGFRDAIEVRQQENEDFDPEDITFNTFRWITTGRGFAMGPSRTNPLTGEILDADIIFDADMVRHWRQERHLYTTGEAGPTSLADEPASPIQAARYGIQRFGLLDPLTGPETKTGWDERGRGQNQLWAIRQGVCQCGPCVAHELSLAATLQAVRDPAKGSEKLSDEMLGQAIKYVTMHEVGHTLGLRHNFKASTMLKASELNDVAITHVKGLIASVMDYAPINLAPKGVKQGDYFTTTLGPYDYWAIEYAYKPLSGGTEGELEKLQEIGTRSAQPGNDYGTDEDLFGSSDPSINVWDLGSESMKFAQQRMLLADELLRGLAERVVEKGEGYQRARQAFRLLLGQYGNAAFLIVHHIGGEFHHRDHRDDPQGRDPVVPVSAASQREALKFLQETILTDKPFHYSPQLLRRLAADRWSHWGNESAFFGGMEFPIHDRILAIQSVVLNHLYNPGVLTRLQDGALKLNKDDQPLSLAEVFRGLSNTIWSELPQQVPNGGGAPPVALKSSVIRRNLQREHLKRLSGLLLDKGSGRAVPADARSLARLHLRELKERIDLTVKQPKPLLLDETTLAHLQECQERIAKVLSASIVTHEP